MLNVFSTLRCTVSAPIKFAVTYTGQLFSKIKSVVAPIFNSIGSFFYSSSMYQLTAGLYGKVTVGNIEERQELLKILDAWHPNCSQDEKTRIMQDIMLCYDQKKTSLFLNSNTIDCLPDVFALRGFSALTSFCVYDCYSLTTLPESVGSLKGLTSLQIVRCESLATLPESIGSLKGLTFFKIKGCNSFQTLPGSIGNLTALTSLYIENCDRLNALPERIGKLKDLSNLELRSCPSIRELPTAIISLSKHCSVCIIACPVSLEVREWLSAESRTESYTGPKIYLDLNKGS